LIVIGQLHLSLNTLLSSNGQIVDMLTYVEMVNHPLSLIIELRIKYSMGKNEIAFLAQATRAIVIVFGHTCNA
jgi:hypothetical protein